MAFQVPKIRIDDTYRIRILVCYILYNLGCPFSEKQLIEIVTDDDMVNYFDLIQALNGIDQNDLCSVSLDNNNAVYTISENGKKTVKEFESHIPLSIREKCLKNAVDIINRVKYKEKYQSKIITLEKGFSVRFRFPHPYFEGNLMELQAFAETEDKAVKLQNQIDDNPRELYKHIYSYLHPDAEVE